MSLTDAIIIPDYGDTEDERYKALEALFKGHEIKPHFAPILWRRSVFTQNIAQFADYYARFDRRTLVIFGYGIGAMVGFVQSAIRPPQALILASMAPWFAEDIPGRATTHKVQHGSGRVGNYQKYAFSDIAPKISSQTWVLYNEGQSRRLPQLRVRAEAVRSNVAGSTLTLVPGDMQDFSGPDYQKSLLDLIQRL
jgi:hypothetical protein